MSKDVDEDLIEATIRRIQAGGNPTGGDPSDSKKAPEEDAIEATIRRVQAQSSAHNSAGGDESEDQPQGSYTAAEKNRIEDTIRRVRTQAASHSEDFTSVSLQGPRQEPEDPIEATIRRVQAQAAQADTSSEEQAPEPDEEDPIEATIRRVQAQAAQADTSSEELAPELDEEDPIEATIRRVEAQAAQADVSSEEQTPELEEEDPIEAAIRRVQAQAAQAEASSEEPAPELDEEDPIEATIRRVQAQAASHALEADDELVPSLPTVDHVEAAIRHAETDQPLGAAATRIDEPESIARPEPTSWPGRDERLLGEATTWEVAALRLEQGLQDAQREVRELAAQLEALIPAMERMAAGGGAASAREAGPLTVVPQSGPSRDDEWDDRPQVSAMQFGTPPRPPVFRDPSPQTATAAELIEEPSPQVEKPTARLRAIDADGNLDERMPRQYRITVEDKRRGVDLVPLHRAMQGLDVVKDMSLLSYSNGVAMVLVESLGPLDSEVLRLAVGRVMSRETLVEVHNEQTMVVKIQEE